MPSIGILFDIDQLGGGLYGWKAYQVLFNAVDTNRIPGCQLSDGDTRATLSGNTRQYCIAIESSSPMLIEFIKVSIADIEDEGLLPLSERFVDGQRVHNEPLVLGAHISSSGELVGDKTGWVTNAWKGSRERHLNSSASSSSADQPLASQVGKARAGNATQPSRLRKPWWKFWG